MPKTKQEQNKSGIRKFLNKEAKDLFSLDLYRGCAAEFLGVFILTFVAIGTGQAAPGDPVAVSLAAGLCVSCLIRILSTMSGGHINPAVSLAFLVLGQITVIRCIFYSITHVLAAAGGTAILKALSPANTTTDNFGMIFPGPGVTDSQALVCEMLITFILLFGAFAMIDHKRDDINGFAPFQIGLIITFNVFATYHISGGSMSPSRTFGPALVSGNFDKAWIYWIGDLVGAVLGALLYDRIFSTKVSTRFLKNDCRRCGSGDHVTDDNDNKYDVTMVVDREKGMTMV